MGPTYVVSARGVLTGIIAAILVCLLDIYFACLLGVLYKEFFSFRAEQGQYCRHERRNWEVFAALQKDAMGISSAVHLC